jgi:shikimate dehydrogenase
MSLLYAVIGHPVAHSKSPWIHQAFAQQCAIDLQYLRVEAPLQGFAETVQSLQKQGYRGANVTVPFKFDAFKLSTQLSARAHAAGAVNTLSFSEHTIIGDNTDGCGLVRDIQQNLQIALRDKRVLLLGAGGAAEGVLQPLLATAPKRLVISNRSLDKAQHMVDKAITANSVESSTQLQALSFADLAGAQFDVVINATSAGLQDAALPLPADIFARQALAYDMMYGRETPFMRLAREQSAIVADGLGMLIEQAAEAFYIWHDVRPDTAEVLAAMRNGSLA